MPEELAEVEGDYLLETDVSVRSVLAYTASRPKVLPCPAQVIRAGGHLRRERYQHLIRGTERTLVMGCLRRCKAGVGLCTAP